MRMCKGRHREQLWKKTINYNILNINRSAKYNHPKITHPWGEGCNYSNKMKSQVLAAAHSISSANSSIISYKNAINNPAIVTPWR